MDNIGIVVESLEAAISFFTELGLELEGRAMIEGEWSGRVTGLRDQRVEMAMMRMPDGHGKIELSRFLTPSPVADHRNAPVNALGYLRVMFAVDDLDDTLARLREHGAQVVDEVVQYEDVIGSATSGARKAFSSGWPSSSADATHESLLRWLQRVWLLHRSRRGSAPPLRLSHLA
jgi:catechol 2,3-dioxygenase-like lactoylglutathione lyase family enzyme